MDKQVQHVVTLSADMKTCFNPVKFGELEEFGGLECFEQVSFILGLGFLVMEGIKNPTF